jgi:hypothetical protein
LLVLLYSPLQVVGLPHIKTAVLKLYHVNERPALPSPRRCRWLTSNTHVVLRY